MCPSTRIIGLPQTPKGERNAHDSDRLGGPMSAEKGTFDVIVYDNFHHGDTEERYVHGTFRTYDEALAEAQKIVESSLRHCYKAGMTSDELYKAYTAFGDDPSVVPGDFSAWTYALSLAPVLASAANEGPD